MSGSVRQYLAMCIVGVVGAGLAFAVLVLARLVQPESIFVQRRMLPRPFVWFRRLARSRMLRWWSPDPVVAAALLGHTNGPEATRLARLGVAVADGPGDADVIVVTELAEGSALTTIGASPPRPFSVLTVGDPSDAPTVYRAFRDLSGDIAMFDLDSTRYDT